MISSDSKLSAPPPHLALWQRLIRLRPTLDDVWLLAPILLALFVTLGMMRIRPHDFWWHLRTGQVIVETHTIPTTDLFSFTRGGMPWVNQSWLMQVFYYLLHQVGGLPLVIFIHAALIGLGYLFVLAACLLADGGQVRAASIAVLAAVFLGFFGWSVRPQAASILMFGVLLWAVESHHAGRHRVIWLLPMLFALWSNLHGAFVFGIALLGLYVATQLASDMLKVHRPGPASRQALVVLLLSTLSLSLNPSGLGGLAGYILGFFQHQATQKYNLEFMAVSAREWDGLAFFAATALVVMVIVARRIPLDVYWAVSLLVFGGLCLFYRRVVIWYGMILAPVIAYVLAVTSTGSYPRDRTGLRVVNLSLLGMMLLFVTLSLPWFRGYLPVQAKYKSYLVEEETAVAAVSRLCQLGPSVRVFNEQGVGSYIDWACPSIPVFVDTRIELYPLEQWYDYSRVVTARFDWETILQRYGINTILVRKDQQAALIDAVRASTVWDLYYEDEYAVIFFKRDSGLNTDS